MIGHYAFGHLALALAASWITLRPDLYFGKAMAQKNAVYIFSGLKLQCTTLSYHNYRLHCFKQIFWLSYKKSNPKDSQ